MYSVETEFDPSNNISTNGTPVFVAFADYRYDPDTFKFENWGLTWPDFYEELLAYNSSSSPLIWRYIGAPVLYGQVSGCGYCYGMAQASIVYWDTPSIKPVPIDTFAMEQGQAETDIRDQHVRQVLALAYTGSLAASNPAIKSPQAALDGILARLEGGQSAPVCTLVMGFHRWIWGGGLQACRSWGREGCLYL